MRVNVHVVNPDTASTWQISAQSAEALWEWLRSSFPESANRLSNNCTLQVYPDFKDGD